MAAFISLLQIFQFWHVGILISEIEHGAQYGDF